MAYVGYNESKKKCNEKYLAKFARPTIRMTEEEKNNRKGCYKCRKVI